MPTTCTRRIQFCAGHRVLGHENKCARVHGHNYVVLIEAAGALDAIGRVIDFSVLKDLCGGWIEREWDHKFLVFSEDKDLVTILGAGATQEGLVIVPFNPTAEKMAEFLRFRFQSLLDLAGSEVDIKSVTLWETENCFAKSVAP